jgi:hypothetical protein
MTLSDPKYIALTTIQVGKRIKDIKERGFGSTSYKHYYVFDSLSYLDCGQCYIFWIWQSHPMSATATQSVDSLERASFLVRSLLCPFIILLNGWTLSPTYCDPQTWQTRRYTTLGVLQLTLQNIVYSFPVGLLWNYYVCSVGIYYNVYHFKKHGKLNILYEKRSKERNCKVYRKVSPTTKWREIKRER